jgi:hypothetical protein
MANPWLAKKDAIRNAILMILGRVGCPVTAVEFSMCIKDRIEDIENELVRMEQDGLICRIPDYLPGEDGFQRV